MEKESINKVLLKGQLLINVPVFIIMFGLPLLVLLLEKNNYIAKGYLFLTSLVSFVLAWLVWSVLITKWKIWAFATVNDIHQLYERAIADKLIWQENSWFNKTEIWSKADKEKWRIILKKLKEEENL